MRPRSLFLNLSRGFVTDYDALADSLKAGHIAGAAIDVFPAEPKDQGDPFDSPLRGIPNVILTPHVGGSTEEAQADIGRFVAGKLGDYVNQGGTTLSVNLPGRPRRRRRAPALAHLHDNTPGVLGCINQRLAEHQINIIGQVLATRGHQGYVVTDTDSPVTPEALTALADLDGTIRMRTLS